jgi:hypothetical protein
VRPFFFSLSKPNVRDANNNQTGNAANGDVQNEIDPTKSNSSLHSDQEEALNIPSIKIAKYKVSFLQTTTR